MNGRIEKIFYSAIDFVNQDLPPGIQMAKSRDAVIVGDNRKIDSLGVVVLLRSIEEGIELEFGRTLDIGEVCFVESQASLQWTIGGLMNCVATVLDLEAK